MRDGILVIDKPQNMTSHDVVSVVRRVAGVKRVGHTGTLDPMATGVLPVCLGSATRVMEYLDLDFKTYRCSMCFGMTTDTLDIWGEKTEDFPTDGLTEERIRAVFARFQGEIWQKPPMFSAVRVNGRRLYDYARAGEKVEVKRRRIFIRDLKVDKIDLAAMEVIFTVTCSKGTYIRTICQDVGKLLGTGAVMTGLTRLSSGVFSLENAVSLDAIKEMTPEEIERRLLPCDFPLVHFGEAVLSPKEGADFVNGKHIPADSCRVEKLPEFLKEEPPFPIREEFRRAYNLYQRNPQQPSQKIFLGVAFYDTANKKLIADKVFFRIQKS